MPALYDQVLDVAKSYMGIAAKDYIDRRCRIVLGGKDPHTLQPAQLRRLAAGIDMTARLYMSLEKAEQFRLRILELAPPDDDAQPNSD